MIIFSITDKTTYIYWNGPQASMEENILLVVFMQAHSVLSAP